MEVLLGQHDYNPKYNPKCNLQMMTLHVKTAKLTSGGNMANKQKENRQESNPLDKVDQNTYTARSGSLHSGGGYFELRVKGHLNNKWSDWLEGLEVKLLDNGEMILSGTIVDQAALMGILNKLNRLNLTLLSVSEVDQPDLH